MDFAATLPLPLFVVAHDQAMVIKCGKVAARSLPKQEFFYGRDLEQIELPAKLLWGGYD